MGRIRILEGAVVDRIAAGEVVERPESVVKELVENALDAGATRVAVRVSEGGCRLIEIADDGHGMDGEDARLAFAQHATSKLASVTDLDAIRTFGFRGEALASIGSVARVELLTATDDGAGTRVRVEGGGEPSVEPAAAPRGTRVSVRDLFFNTPARRKHLKTAPTELGRVARVVEEFALLRPDVHFRLEADGRERLEAAPVAELAERVHQVLGAELAELWIPVDGTGSRVHVHGGVTDPLHARRDRRRIHLFVNGRAIQDGRMAHAVVAAFDTLLDRGRYPAAVLFLELPLEDVDVNVHPRKAEVRFVEPGRVFGSVRRAVQEALARYTAPAPLDLGHRPGSRVREALRPESQEGRSGSLPLRDWRVTEGAPAARPPLPSPAEGRPIPGSRGAIQPLGQYANTYILAADEDGLLIIDQHVAHERILYERILAARARQAVPVQRLLVPETMDLSASEATVAEEQSDLLSGFGFEIEPFGGRTWTLRAVPEMLGSRSGVEAVRAVLGSLAEETGAEAAEKLERDLAASIACHSAVRASQPLSAETMSHLLSELSRCEAPNRCPHGRPVLVRVKLEELERQLHRH